MADENESKRKTDKDLKRRLAIYAGNYIPRLIQNLAKYGTNEIPPGESYLGHPYSALGFAGLDILVNSHQDLKNSAYYKLAKLGGFLTFTGLAGIKLVNFVKGDYTHWANFFWDTSMALSLGHDLKELGSDFFNRWDWGFGQDKKKNPDNKEDQKSIS